MYLAPLNYDRYFKKVFSDLRIAKRFLEDFFDVTIQEIEILKVQHKITDDAIAVEFDFRCKIDDQLVIIDMQQWYKPDVVHRFYTYHCINTALQLESLPLKSIALEGDKERKIKDYNEIVPVITLVWMVDDTFGFKEDYKGQVTFFEEERFQLLCAQFQVWDRPSSVFRRNLITEGQDLNALIGKEFEIQGVRFLGMAECSPCHWMDEAFHPGAEAALKNHGGLRAKILTDGVLRVAGKVA